MNKKILSLYAVLLLAFSVKAQFTITQNSVPQISDIEYNANDTLPSSSISAGNSGTNQVWDFSALNNSYSDTTYYIDPAGTPAASKFPLANIVIHDNAGFAYCNVDASNIRVFGAHAENPLMPGDSIDVEFKPVGRPMHFPSTYLTTFKDTQAFKITFYFGQVIGGQQIDSMRITHTAYNDNIFDAYGKTTTPTGVFNNTMRMNQYTLSTDEVEGYVMFGPFGSWVPLQTINDTITTYTWYCDQFKSTIANLTYRGGATMTLTQASYLTGVTPNGIASVQADKQRVIGFPNPASNEYAISFNDLKVSAVAIFDITGKQISSNSVLSQHKQITVNTHNYPAGAYFYKLLDRNGATLTTGKFNVVR